MPAKKKTTNAKAASKLSKRQNALLEAVAGPSSAKLSAFVAGDRVSHPQFGIGSIVAIEGSSLSIAFDAHGARRIIDSYVKRLRG